MAAYNAAKITLRRTAQTQYNVGPWYLRGSRCFLEISSSTARLATSATSASTSAATR